MDNSEKVLLGGWETKSGHPQMLVIRLTSDGVVDSSTFNHSSPDAGELYINSFPNTTGSKAFSMVQDINMSSDIFLGGYSSRTEGSCTACDFAIAAVTVDGVLDTNFGPSANGVVATSFYDKAQSCGVSGCCGAQVSQDSDYSLLHWQDTNDTTHSKPWYLYAVGATNYSGAYSFGMARYNVTHGTMGTLDTSWQYGGLTAVLSGAAGTTKNAKAFAATLEGGTTSGGAETDPNAKIVAAGGNSSSDFVVARFSLAGNLDTTFGSSGAVSTDLANSSFNTGYDVALGVGWDPTDSVIFAGGTTGSTSAGGYIGLAAYISNQLVVASRLRPRLIRPPAVTLGAAESVGGASGSDSTTPVDGPLRRHPRSRPPVVAALSP